MTNSPVCPSPAPDGEAVTDACPEGSQVEEAGTAARRWVPWDLWLGWYEQAQGG